MIDFSRPIILGYEFRRTMNPILLFLWLDILWAALVKNIFSFSPVTNNIYFNFYNVQLISFLYLVPTSEHNI